jgi:serine phosphatase RsbU (regulator of sigma subunit)
MVAAALAGEASFFSDQEAAFAELSAHDALAFWGAVEASAAVPLRTGGRTIGALLVAFDHTQHWREPEQELVEALATLTAQALDRIRARIAEKQANAASRRLSETLQRSLLAAPPQYGDLQIAVRYQPAAAEAHVGGDWYDAFVTGDGRLMLVIGDVAGHDRGATAAMAQLRNLLRGVAQTLTGSPAAVLSGLDQALDGLQVTALATAVLTQIERCTGPRGATRWRLRWSNAGHPPPLLIGPQGRSELLERPAELPIGADSDTRRADHELLLLPGSSLILYTDGLIERRGQPLDDGFARLQEAVADLGHLPAEQLSDALLDRLGSDAEDDVALLVLEIPA